MVVSLCLQCQISKHSVGMLVTRYYYLLLVTSYHMYIQIQIGICRQMYELFMFAYILYTRYWIYICIYAYNIVILVIHIHIHIQLYMYIYTLLYRLYLKKSYPMSIHMSIASMMFGAQSDIFDYHYVCSQGYRCIYRCICINIYIYKCINIYVCIQYIYHYLLDIRCI